jgi:hypothetical protein
MENNKTLFLGTVTDINDPLNIGRVRINPTDEQMAFAYPEGFTDADKWGPKDPLIFLPFLPYYLWQIPLINESVFIIYVNKDERRDSNKFYKQGPISRPWNNRFESYNNSQSVLASGESLKLSESTIDPLTGKIKIGLEGVYPKPGDNGLLGRGSSDFILIDSEGDGISTALIRSGKYLSSGNDSIPVVKNDGRSFLQLSSYELENIATGTETITTETYKDINTKSYVQWTINNLDSTGFTYDGVIKFYNLSNTNSELIKVSNITVGTDILLGQPSTPNYKIDFTGKTLSETSELINAFIKGVNNGNINIDGYTTYFIEDQFPFFYGPDSNTYNYILSDVFDLISHLSGTAKASTLYNKVTLSDGYKEKGYGLVWAVSPPRLGILSNVNIEEVNKRDYIVNPITYSVMGGDKIFFLSHRSKGSFTVDLKETLYGIPQDKLVSIGEDTNTNSMVRGEELMKFLSLITKFLVSHVHPFAGCIPIPIAGGTSVPEIEAKLNNADNTILNQNIRIN